MILLVDVSEAVALGTARYQDAVAKSRQTHRGVQKDQHGDNLIGMIGELIVARYFNLPWHHTIGASGQIDVANKLEVRTRRPTQGYQAELPYRTDDSEYPHLPYVLVIYNHDHHAFIEGWLYGHECLARVRECNLRPDPANGVWYIPRPYRSLGELRKLLSQ